MAGPPIPNAVVVHIPHSSTSLPTDLRQALLLSDQDLNTELLRMTDAYTDEFFAGSVGGAQTVVFPVSRLMLDPERFEDDADEPMAERGMGVIYERTSGGATLRHPPSQEERNQLLDRFYRPHHDRLTRCVDAAVASHGRCLIIDGHSFPSLPLPYEPDQVQPRPDICIGTDAFHTPPRLCDTAVRTSRDLGWSVAIDRPFAGSIVPVSHYRSDCRVFSVMVEVNRQLYMNESTGRRLAAFVGVRDRLHQLINALAASI